MNSLSFYVWKTRFNGVKVGVPYGVKFGSCFKNTLAIKAYLGIGLRILHFYFSEFYPNSDFYALITSDVANET